MTTYSAVPTAKGVARHGMSLADVAELVGLSEQEIVWAIEEYGECETDTYTVYEEEEV